MTVTMPIPIKPASVTSMSRRCIGCISSRGCPLTVLAPWADGTSNRRSRRAPPPHLNPPCSHGTSSCLSPRCLPLSKFTASDVCRLTYAEYRGMDGTSLMRHFAKSTEADGVAEGHDRGHFVHGV